MIFATEDTFWLHFTVTAVLAFVGGVVSTALWGYGRYLQIRREDSEGRIKTKELEDSAERHNWREHASATESQYQEAIKSLEALRARQNDEYEKKLKTQEQQIAQVQSMHMDCLKESYQRQAEIREMKLHYENKIALLEERVSGQTAEMAQMRQTFAALITTPEEMKAAFEIVRSRKQASS